MEAGKHRNNFCGRVWDVKNHRMTDCSLEDGRNITWSCAFLPLQPYVLLFLRLYDFEDLKVLLLLSFTLISLCLDDFTIHYTMDVTTNTMLGLKDSFPIEWPSRPRG